MGISGPDEINVSFSSCLQKLQEEYSPEIIDAALLQLLRETFQAGRVSFYLYQANEGVLQLLTQTENIPDALLPQLQPAIPLGRLRPLLESAPHNGLLHILPRLPFAESPAAPLLDPSPHTVVLCLPDSAQLWGVVCLESFGAPGRKTQVELTEYYRDCFPFFACLLLKQQNQSLQKKNLDTEASARRKMAFLANMSHDIRTPLNAIVGFSKLIAETEELAERQKYSAIVEKNNELLLQLISDILDLAKIEAGTVTIRYTTANLNECFTALIESASGKLGRHVVIDYVPALPVCYIRTDPNRIMQVIGNFLNNALKFTSMGVVRLGYLIDNKTLEIFVEDSGIGIPQPELETIFNPYVRLNSDFQGTGLGLAICKTIVEMMQGTIGATSELGAGARFWCRIPYQPIEQ